MQLKRDPKHEILNSNFPVCLWTIGDSRVTRLEREAGIYVQGKGTGEVAFNCFPLDCMVFQVGDPFEYATGGCQEELPCAAALARRLGRTLTKSIFLLSLYFQFILHCGNPYVGVFVYAICLFGNGLTHSAQCSCNQPTD